jgi:MFS family permease
MPLAWRTILALSFIGLAIGALSLFGLWPDWFEAILWTLTAALLVVPVLLRTRAPSPFLSAVLVYVIAGVFTGGIQTAFAQTYVDHHPATAAQLQGAGPLRVAGAFLGFGIGVGLVFGILVGLVAWLLARRRDAAPRAGA